MFLMQCLDCVRNSIEGVKHSKLDAQEVPDYGGRRSELKRIGDEVGLAIEQADVKRRRTAWIKRSSQNHKQQLWRPRKRYRSATALVGS